ncbi:MAG TPA: uracil-DNA glycosylase [Solirubrobacteraceae bacterium]
MATPQSTEDRREALKQVYLVARTCARCPQLAQTRTQVVFGAGNADADLMFVGEAPGRDEDEQGLPFVGRSGQLLNTLLGEIGLQRDDVFIANVLKCRPPQNRDPHPEEIERCSPYLWRQLELIQPTVVVTLGNFATKLLRGDPAGIRAIHGRAEERVLGPRRVRLFPVYHPAAALRSTVNLGELRADFGRIPELIAQGAPEQPEPVDPAAEPSAEDVAAARAEAAQTAGTPAEPAPPTDQPAPPESQLGLF